MADRIEDVRLYMNNEVSPKEDFFTYAIGKWVETTEIPADKPMYGSFFELLDISKEQVKTVLEQDHTDPEMRKAILFYNKGKNFTERNSHGYDPIKPYLQMIEGINSRESLIDVIINLSTNSLPHLFVMYSAPDSKNTSIEAPHLYASGLTLSNKDYYSDDDKAEIRVKMEEMHRSLMSLIGDANAGDHAKQNMDVETKLAEKHHSQVQKRDPDLTYNKFELSELKSRYPNFPWERYFRAYTDTPISYIILDNPEFYDFFNSLLNDLSLESWKSFLTAQVLSSTANYLSEEFEDARFEFFGKTLSGTPEKQDVWKRIMSVVNSRSMIGELIGKLYVDKYFPPEAKATMKGLVDNLFIILEERIKNLEWMGEETKQKALHKLSKFNVKIGYPDVWENYNDLHISDQDSFSEMIRKTSLFHRKIKFSRLYQAPDRNRWGMSPQTVNAYYNPSFNEIVFPAAFLQFPFFDMNMSMAENFGAIGLVIGHEITHGFDDEGSKYDADGNLNMWWTDEDRAKFEVKTKYFIEEYNNFLVGGKPVNGELTLGENLADHGGLKVAYHAMQKYYETNPREDEADLSSEKKFFMSYARVWRSKARPEIEEQLRMSDPHSPAKARVNVALANMKEFHDIYGIQEGDAMYRPDLPIVW